MSKSGTPQRMLLYEFCGGCTGFCICNINPLNAKLNPISHLLELLGAHHILHISRIRVKARFSEETKQLKRN
jgi:hypothetical protein